MLKEIGVFWAGLGIQFQITMKGISVGVELIWFPNKKVIVWKNRWKPYAFVYSSSSTRGNAKIIWDEVIPMKDPLPMLQGFCKPRTQVSAIAVFGYRNNGKNSFIYPEDYQGFSGGLCVTINHVAIGSSYSSKGFTLSGGWSEDKYDIDAIFTHSMLYNVKMSSACNSHYTAIKSKVIGWGLA